MIFQGKNNEFIQLKTLVAGDNLVKDNLLYYPLIFIWTKDKKTQVMFEDEFFSLPSNSILCFTEFHKVEFNNISEARFIKFNREFYCVLDHDKEVSCKGILFFGANQLPVFQIPEGEIEKFEVLWKMFQIEMQSKDELQLEMLQTMLKRFIILCTRIYKAQNNFLNLKSTDVDIVRNFHFLVEQHFKTKHAIEEYATLLNKSPKTISNLFSVISSKTPLQIIRERKMLEARRMLRYTDKSVKEIAYEIGFEDIQTFSRFFKKHELISPSEYKISL